MNLNIKRNLKIAVVLIFNTLSLIAVDNLEVILNLENQTNKEFSIYQIINTGIKENKNFIGLIEPGQMVSSNTFENTIKAVPDLSFTRHALELRIRDVNDRSSGLDLYVNLYGKIITVYIVPVKYNSSAYMSVQKPINMRLNSSPRNLNLSINLTIAGDDFMQSQVTHIG